jgi:hypothetical protein
MAESKKTVRQDSPQGSRGGANQSAIENTREAHFPKAPPGTPAHSPAFQRWDLSITQCRVPAGTAELNAHIRSGASAPF